MIHNIFYLLLITLCSQCTNVKASFLDDDYIKCPLVWTPITSGDSALSLNGISSSSIESEYFIARILGGDGKLYFGQMQEIGKCRYIMSGIIYDAETCEILTNPNGCQLNWLSDDYKGIYAVKIDSEFGTKMVGRGVAGDQSLPGEVYQNNIYIINGLEKSVLTEFDILVSFSKGLTLKMTDFLFENDPFDSEKDFLGIDEIHNRANSRVSHTVHQMKRVYQKSTVKTSSSWSKTYKVDFKIEVSLNLGKSEENKNSSMQKVTLGVGIGYEFQNAKSNSEEITTETETEISVTRTVIVEPFSSVQICSTVSMKEDFELNYIAKGQYTAPGLTGQEILDILTNDNKFGTIIGNTVVVEEEGTFGGSLSMATQFMVFPYESFGCSQLSSKIASLKRDVKFGKVMKGSEELNKKRKELNQLIYKGLGWI